MKVKAERCLGLLLHLYCLRLYNLNQLHLFLLLVIYSLSYPFGGPLRWKRYCSVLFLSKSILGSVQIMGLKRRLGQYIIIIIIIFLLPKLNSMRNL
jgi:hypothetical protein